MQKKEPHTILRAFLKEFEKARLLKRSGKRFELMHDSLADKIAARRSAQEMGLVEAVRLLRSKFLMSQRTETKDFFTEQQLVYLAPFVAGNIHKKFDQPDWASIQKLLDESRDKIKREKLAEQERLEAEKKQLLENQKLLKKNQGRQRIIIAILSIALLASTFALYQSIKIEHLTFEAQLKRAKTYKIEGQYVKAIALLSNMQEATQGGDFEIVQNKIEDYKEIYRLAELATAYQTDSLYQEAIQAIQEANAVDPDQNLLSIKTKLTESRDLEVTKAKYEINRQLGDFRNIDGQWYIGQEPITLLMEAPQSFRIIYRTYLNAQKFDSSKDLMPEVRTIMNQIIDVQNWEKDYPFLPET